MKLAAEALSDASAMTLDDASVPIQVLHLDFGSTRRRFVMSSDFSESPFLIRVILIGIAVGIADLCYIVMNVL